MSGPSVYDSTPQTKRNAEIRKRRAAGETVSALAREYEISLERVRQIILHPNRSARRSQKQRAEARAYRALVAQGLAPPIVLEGEGTTEGGPRQ